MNLVRFFKDLLIKVHYAVNHVNNGGKVWFQNYLYMPHVFMCFPKHPSTETCYKQITKFIKEVTSGGEIENRMEVVNGKGIIEELSPKSLKTFPQSEVPPLS
jgi:hypothetical protein